jgi:hypothetical protein
MSELPAGLSNEQFVGYTFQGSPPRRPRLWFLDRHLHPLVVWGSQIMWPGAAGTELTQRIRYGECVRPSEIRAQAILLDLDVGQWTMNMSPDQAHREWPTNDPYEVIELAMPGLTMRYEHWGVESWSAVWKLTDVTIHPVHTFGDDDTWRLGVWPD